jgi:hypothetical protein|tara:strand:+ start:2419 stop:2682 length:264 start_codon:yes stop_codon:yes gene_type:complete
MVTETRDEEDIFFDKLIAHYITTTVEDGREYICLRMNEYDFVEYYPTDKYNILEVFQDMDSLNFERQKLVTNFFERYNAKYCTWGVA